MGKDLSILELLRIFPDDQKAQEWFEEKRWPDYVYCPLCDSTNVTGSTHPLYALSVPGLPEALLG